MIISAIKRSTAAAFFAFAVVACQGGAEPQDPEDTTAEGRDDLRLDGPEQNEGVTLDSSGGDIDSARTWLMVDGHQVPMGWQPRGGTLEKEVDAREREQGEPAAGSIANPPSLETPSDGAQQHVKCPPTICCEEYCCSGIVDCTFYPSGDYICHCTGMIVCCAS